MIVVDDRAMEDEIIKKILLKIVPYNSLVLSALNNFLKLLFVWPSHSSKLVVTFHCFIFKLIFDLKEMSNLLKHLDNIIVKNLLFWHRNYMNYLLGILYFLMIRWMARKRRKFDDAKKYKEKKKLYDHDK